MQYTSIEEHGNWDLYDCKKVSSWHQPCSQVPNPLHFLFFGCQTPSVTSSDVWTLYENCPEGNAALLYDALLQGTWQALGLLVLVFLLWFYMCGLWSYFCILAFEYSLCFWMSELYITFSFQAFVFTICSREFGISAPFLITFSSVGKENSDGGKTSAPDYISVCLLLIFIIVGNIWPKKCQKKGL